MNISNICAIVLLVSHTIGKSILLPKNDCEVIDSEVAIAFQQLCLTTVHMTYVFDEPFMLVPFVSSFMSSRVRP